MGDSNSTSVERKLGNFAVTRENPRYAYYSFRQHIRMRTQVYTRQEYSGKTRYYKRNGYNVWLTEDGDEVMATELVKERDDEKMRGYFEDSVYKGKVVKWVRWVEYNKPPSPRQRMAAEFGMDYLDM